MVSQSNYITLAKKLKALADRGIGGEKQTAASMLNALMKKHSITIEEIDGEKLNDYYFKIENNNISFLNQITKKVNGSIKVYSFPKEKEKEYSLPGNILITCTVSEYLEIEAKYAFYQNLYKEELAIFYTAFLSANDLLCDDMEGDYKSTEKDLRAHVMAKSIKKGTFLKQIMG